VSINSHIRILLTPIGIFMLLSERYRTTKDERMGRFANPSYYDTENDEDVTGWRANELNTRSMYKQDRHVLKRDKKNGRLDISKVRYGAVDDAMMNRRATLITDLMYALELATNHLSNYIQIVYSKLSHRIYFCYNFRLNALDGKIKKAVLAAFHDVIDVSSAFPEYVQAFGSQPELKIFAAGSDESRFILYLYSIDDTDVDLTVPREIRKQFLLDKAKEVAAILPEREIVRRLSTMLNNMIKAAMSRSDNVTKRS
jgi:hypothetical protein